MFNQNYTLAGHEKHAGAGMYADGSRHLYCGTKVTETPPLCQTVIVIAGRDAFM